MNALLYALATLARLRWLGAAFCALAIVCTTANANAIAPGTEHEQAKTRVGGFEQNPVLNVCANTLASGFSSTGTSTLTRCAQWRRSTLISIIRRESRVSSVICLAMIQTLVVAS